MKQGIILKDYQQKTVTNFIASRKNYRYLAYDVGKGKTAAIIAILENIMAEQKKTLVLCPSSIVRQWKSELLKFSDKFSEIKILEGSGAKKIKALEGFKNGIGIVIANHDTISNIDISSFWQPDIIVVDEMHKFKTPNSKRTKALFALGRRSLYRFALSGTPAPNSLLDYWSQYVFLSQDSSILTDNFYIFKNKYFYDANAPKRARMGSKYFPDYKPTLTAVDDIKRAIKTCTDFEFWKPGELPEYIIEKRDSPLTAEEAKTYKDMKKDLVTFFEGIDRTDMCMVQSVLAKVIRLHQITCGYIPVVNTDVTGVRPETSIKKLETNRTGVLEDILESLPMDREKVIIWTVYRETYKDIKGVLDKMKLTYVFVTGNETPLEKQKAIDAFKNGEVQVFVANPATAASGLNLTIAKYAIYYSRGFNLEYELQSKARNYRIGSDIHENIVRFDIVTPDSIDEHIIEILGEKSDLQDLVTDRKLISKIMLTI